MRDFWVTTEPGQSAAYASVGLGHLGFVVQKHWESRPHYDFVVFAFNFDEERHVRNSN
jgi:hypothetical protein